MTQAEEAGLLHNAVLTRRKALQENAPQPAEQALPAMALNDPVWGMALSGGGIRSATFCLGVIRSLAANKMLLRFDLLSTVSGGGYIGGMLGRLFDHARSNRVSASKVNDALAQAEKNHFGWWLRANGRYLSPTGFSDTAFAASLYLRNLIGIHLEFGIIAALLALFICLVNLLVWQLLFSAGVHLPALFGHILWLQQWIPTLWIIAPAICVPWGLHCLLAYWQLRWAKAAPVGARLQGIIAVTVSLGLPVLLLIRLNEREYLTLSNGQKIAMVCIGGFLFLTLTAWINARCTLKTKDTEGEARNALTHALSSCLFWFSAFMALGAIDRLAWLIAFESDIKVNLGLMLGVAAVGLRALAPLLPPQDKAAHRPRSSLGWWALQSMGYMLSLCLMIWWTAWVTYLVMDPVFARTTVGTDGEQREVAARLQFAMGWIHWLLLAIPVGAYALLTGRNLEFLNLSSLHKFYAARLTRAYLGAANGMRFGNGAAAISPIGAASRTATPDRSVGEVHKNDDAPLREYCPHLAGGPVHVINVCVNQSAATSSSLYNRDRQGLLLSVMGGGSSCLSQGTWKKDNCLANMSLGTWLAISGAAVSPGLGSRTRKGLSALLTFAGIRLGYWVTAAARGVKTDRRSWTHLLGKSFGLLSEAAGTFTADPDSDWLLSDGGHFENTGAYTLLAARAQFVLVVDCGADPSYSFDDLENLVRKARIDLGTDIEFQKPVERPTAWADRLAYFGSLNDLASSQGRACLALATIRYPQSGHGMESKAGILVVIKPNMCRGLPMDIENFRLRHPDFPQQPISDQFFSEEQWESYFSLGRFLADRLSPRFVKAIIESPHLYFETDDLVPLGSNGAKVPPGVENQGEKSPGSRLPQRIGSVAVGATLSASAVATVAISVWQGAEGLRASTSDRIKGERAAMKELVDLWAGLPPVEPPGMGPPAPVTDQSRAAAAALAAAVVRAADAYCPNNEADWLGKSQLGTKIINDITAECRRQTFDRTHACTVLLASFNGPRPSLYSHCLNPPGIIYSSPAYWGYDYSKAATWPEMHPCSTQRDAMVRANKDFILRDFRHILGVHEHFQAQTSLLPLVERDTDGVPEHLQANPSISQSALNDIRHDVCPPSAFNKNEGSSMTDSPPAGSTSQPPASSASAPASAPPVPGTPSPDQSPAWQQESSVCRGVTIYIQIYGPEDRDAARNLRTWWRRWGANVPPIEDVNDSARRAGRATPLPVRQTELRYHDARAEQCARDVAKAANDLRRGAGWKPAPLGVGLKSTPGVLEVWLQPRDAVLRAVVEPAQRSTDEASAPSTVAPASRAR